MLPVTNFSIFFSCSISMRKRQINVTLLHLFALSLSVFLREFHFCAAAAAISLHLSILGFSSGFFFVVCLLPFSLFLSPFITFIARISLILQLYLKCDAPVSFIRCYLFVPTQERHPENCWCDLFVCVIGKGTNVCVCFFCLKLQFRLKCTKIQQLNYKGHITIEIIWHLIPFQYLFCHIQYSIQLIVNNIL